MSSSLSPDKKKTQNSNKEVQKILAAFKEDLLRHKNRSPNTIRSYLRVAENYCEHAQLEDSVLFSHESLSRFLRDCSKNLSSRSQAQSTSALNSFMNFVHREGKGPKQKAPKLRTPKTPSKHFQILSEDQVLALAKAIEKNGTVTEQLLFQLLYGSALRVSEAFHLSLQDFDTQKQSVRILGKGRKRRLVPLTPKASKILKELEKNKKAPSLWGEIKNVRTIRRICEKWSSYLPENELHIYPHLLRHSLASHLLKRGLPLPDIQRLLGHTRLSTTQRYTHLDVKDLIRCYEDCHRLK